MAGKSTRATARIQPEPEPEPEDELLLETEEPLAEVTKRTLTTERYFEPRPTAGPQVIQDEPEKDWVDQLISERGDARTLDLIVHHLPFYDSNGNTSTTAPGRTWVTRLRLNRENKDTFRETVQAFLPSGGWFHFDLRDGGDLVKNGRWVEKLAALPHQPAPAAGVPAYPVPQVTVQPPAPVDPFAAVKPAMGFVKDMFDFAQRMIPPPAPAALATNGTVSEKPIGERLLEGAFVKLVESDKVGPDKVIEMLGASREPSFWESDFLQEAAKGAFGPGGAITLLSQAWSQRIQAQTQIQWLEAQTKAKQAGIDPETVATGTATMGAAQEGTASQAQIPGAGSEAEAPLTDEQKMDKAWRKTASRIVEDCMDGGSVNPAAHCIVDLVERYGDKLRPFVDSLLQMEPAKVLQSFAQFAPTEQIYHRINNLAGSQLNLDWIKLLQEKATEALTDWDEDQRGEEEAQ